MNSLFCNWRCNIVSKLPILPIGLQKDDLVGIKVIKKKERKRIEAKERGLKPKYDGKCRDLGLGKAPGAVVRLKSPLSGKTTFKDLGKGDVIPN